MRNGEWLPEIWAWVGPGLESRRSNLKHYFCSTAFFGVHWNWNDGQNQTLNFLSNFASVQEKFPLRCLMPGGTYIHLYFALELFLSQKTPDWRGKTKHLFEISFGLWWYGTQVEGFKLVYSIVRIWLNWTKPAPNDEESLRNNKPSIKLLQGRTFWSRARNFSYMAGGSTNRRIIWENPDIWARWCPTGAHIIPLVCVGCLQHCIIIWFLKLFSREYKMLHSSDRKSRHWSSVKWN